MREMFVQIFGVPDHHPKSQPFVDNVLNFSVLDNRIWFRNYQILDENGAIAEIGMCDSSILSLYLKLNLFNL